MSHPLGNRAAWERPSHLGAAVFEKVVQQSPNAVVIVDDQLCIHFFNGGAERIFGYEAAEVIGQSLTLLLPQGSRIRRRKRVTEFSRGSVKTLRMGRRRPIAGRRKNGREFPVEATLAPIAAEGHTFFSAILRDLSEIKRKEARLTRQSLEDGLTGLPNRRAAIKFLARAIERAKQEDLKVAVLFVDLDNFKGINDGFGHSRADMLLRKMGRAFRGLVRHGDMVARLGGDEFLVVLTGITTALEAAKIADRFLRAARKPFLVAGKDVYITSSVGVALYPDHGETAEIVVGNADSAMYCAKHERKNRVWVFEPAVAAALARRNTLESDLRRALEQQELVVYYQPRVEYRAMSVCGLEALVRWRHPTWGLLAPDEFIPIAEETGLIVQLDAWVLRTAIQQLKVWHEAGLSNLSVSVNFSPLLLHDPKTGELVKQSLADAGLPGRFLQVEITEATAMREFDGAIAVLNRLKEADVQIALDDFGKGYSSLTYLSRLPVDTLKIDNSFVRRLDVDAGTRMLVSAIISLAHSFRLAVVAEGVETHAQQQFLIDQACDEGQGELYAPPLPGPDATALCTTRDQRPYSGRMRL